MELDFFFLLLTGAGSETTRNAITLGMKALLEHPDQLELLRADPGLGRSATEEILRWSSPAAYFRRTATRDTEIRGVPIKEGDRVSMWFGSGNRDEDVFEDRFASISSVHLTSTRPLAEEALTSAWGHTWRAAR